MPSSRLPAFFLRLSALLAALALAGGAAVAQSQAAQDIGQQGGPVRLLQPTASKPDAGKADAGLRTDKRRSTQRTTTLEPRDADEQLPRETPLSEFERYVTRLAAAPKAERDPSGEPLQRVRRFGADLLWASPDDERGAGGAAVTDDYIVGPGDELQLDIWGGVEASLRLPVSRRGTVSIPRVGTVAVAGTRFADLPKLLRQQVARQFRQFELAVSMGELRPMRVYVTGFVQKPGVHLVPSQSGLAEALAAAGGPSSVGSYRQLQLRRAGALVATLDLYELLLRGQLANETRLQSGDVIHVPAVGAQVAVIGSVNNPAVFELKGGESLEDLLRMAGGLAPVAQRDSATVIGLAGPPRQLRLNDGKAQLAAGEVLRVANAAEMSRPSAQQGKRIRVEGEVQRPGDYVLPAGATLRDAVAAAGGLSAQAFVYGAEFNRESLRRQQAESYERALRELETEFARAAVTRKERVGPPADGESQKAPVGHLRLIERLRQVQPSGRVVLQLKPQDSELPALALEDGDRLMVPSRPPAVSVFGSVANAGSFLFSDGKPLDHYLSQAGGVSRGGDARGVFVLRADGSVLSNRVMGSWWNANGIERLAALPGDTLFVPEEIDKVRLTQELKDWAQILSQFGLGAVALRNLTN